jgi:hydroxymethylpyrimidine pyrophosphatase-like HAD family hydrolase
MTILLESGQLIPGPRYEEQKNTEARVVLSDVDNTILPSESLGLPTSRVTHAFHEVGEKLPTGLATARQPQKFEYLARHLKLTGKSILSNGAQIFDGKDGLMVVERVLRLETAIDIAKALQVNKVDHWIQDGGIDFRWIPQGKVTPKAKATSEGLGLYRRPQDVLNPNKGFTDVPRYIPNKPFIIVAHMVDASIAMSIQEMVKGHKDESIVAFIAHQFKNENSSTFDVFIADKRANKRDALFEIEQMSMISLEDFLAIGDGHNDKVLIENAGLGVAMGNAVELVKQVAAFIAPDCKHDGAAIALEELVLKKTSSSR